MKDASSYRTKENAPFRDRTERGVGGVASRGTAAYFRKPSPGALAHSEGKADR